MAEAAGAEPERVPKSRIIDQLYDELMTRDPLSASSSLATHGLLSQQDCLNCSSNTTSRGWNHNERLATSHAAAQDLLQARPLDVPSAPVAGECCDLRPVKHHHMIQATADAAAVCHYTCRSTGCKCCSISAAVVAEQKAQLQQGSTSSALVGAAGVPDAQGASRKAAAACARVDNLAMWPPHQMPTPTLLAEFNPAGQHVHFHKQQLRHAVKSHSFESSADGIYRSVQLAGSSIGCSAQLAMHHCVVDDATAAGAAAASNASLFRMPLAANELAALTLQAPQPGLWCAPHTGAADAVQQAFYDGCNNLWQTISLPQPLQSYGSLNSTGSSFPVDITPAQVAAGVGEASAEATQETGAAMNPAMVQPLLGSSAVRQVAPLGVNCHLAHGDEPSCRCSLNSPIRLASSKNSTPSSCSSDLCSECQALADLGDSCYKAVNACATAQLDSGTRSNMVDLVIKAVYNCQHAVDGGQCLLTEQLPQHLVSGWLISRAKARLAPAGLQRAGVGTQTARNFNLNTNTPMPVESCAFQHLYTIRASDGPLVCYAVARHPLASGSTGTSSNNGMTSTGSGSASSAAPTAKTMSSSQAADGWALSAVKCCKPGRLKGQEFDLLHWAFICCCSGKDKKRRLDKQGSRQAAAAVAGSAHT